MRARFCSIDTSTQRSSLAGCGDFSGMFGPGRDSDSYFAPVISRSCSTAVARVRFAAITAAAA